MHIVFLVEDSSGQRLLEHLVPKLIGPNGDPHTWRIFGYRGAGHIPRGLTSTSDPSHRILLDRLPALLAGHARTPGTDAIVVVTDTDRQNCKEFLAELKQVAETKGAADRTLFRLAIEEMEALYFGDRTALLAAWPRAKKRVLNRYKQDQVCGTWEMLADAVHPGGAAALRTGGWPSSGDAKHEWAERMGPLMDPSRNLSPSFGKLRDGLHRLTATPTLSNPAAPR